MRLWFDRHRRFRDQLSAFIDGELDEPAVERLERHLTVCDPCRAELEQLRATVAALQELPEAELPRSFALSPERVAAPRPTPLAAQPLAFGMRIAAAGVAAALAVVLLVDLGDIGGDGARDEAAAPQMLSERQADEGAFEATAPEPDAAEAPAAPPEEAAEAAKAADGGDGVSALTVAEIALAAALGLLVAGSLALAYARRKR